MYFVVKIRDKGSITIPITVRESLKLKTGDIVEIDIKKANVMMADNNE